MGKKVNPLAMRPDYKYAVWVATSPKLFGQYVVEDCEIRRIARETFTELGYFSIGIERIGMQTNIKIYSYKQNMLISGRNNESKKGALIDQFKNKLKRKVFGNKPFALILQDFKIKQESSAGAIATNLARNVAARTGGSYRSLTKRAMSAFMRAHRQHVGGIKIIWNGRINGTEIARSEKFQDGKMPTSSIKENVDFHYAVAHTDVGTVTVRVYTYLPAYELLREEKRKMEGNRDHVFRSSDVEPPRPHEGKTPSKDIKVKKRMLDDSDDEGVEDEPFVNKFGIRLEAAIEKEKK